MPTPLMVWAFAVSIFVIWCLELPTFSIHALSPAKIGISFESEARFYHFFSWMVEILNSFEQMYHLMIRACISSDTCEYHR